MNIENLFKNALENAEATPPAGAWEAIQAQMGASATAATTTAAGLGIGKVAAIVITALGIGLGAGYLAFNKSGDKTSNQNQEQKESTITSNNETAAVVLPEDVKITEITSVQKDDKIVSVVKVQKDNEIKTYKVTSDQQQNNFHGTSTGKSRNESVVGQWLSPKSDNLNKQAILQRIIDELEKEDSEETADNTEKTPVKVNNTTTLEDITSKVEAVIVPVVSTDNPLKVTFHNTTNASAYEWDFGDGTTSNEASPVHVYSSPGNKVIALKTYDKSGKIYKDQMGMEVFAKEEVSETGTAGESAINIPEGDLIFTPNGDGNHDEFYLTGKNIESFTITIVSGTGRVVYTSNDINQHWDGTDKNGIKVPVGTYQYILKAVGKDGKVHQKPGTVTISR